MASGLVDRVERLAQEIAALESERKKSDPLHAFFGGGSGRLDPSKLKEFVAEVKKRAKEALFSLPPHRAKVSELVELFSAAEEPERDAVRGAVKKRKLSGVLLAYAADSANLAVREKDSAEVSRGLVALALEDFSVDYRDDLVFLTMLSHAAKTLGIDGESLFAKAASLCANPQARAALAGAAKNPVSLSSMGLAEGKDGEGRFMYRQVL